MTKYRIRMANGRVIGPFEKPQLFELKANGRIKGTEEAQVFPTGNWGPIKQFDFYAELMDENKTVLQSKEQNENTFVIDLTQIRNHKNEKELEKYNQGTQAPIEHLTETVRLNQAIEKIEVPSPALEKTDKDLTKLKIIEPSQSKIVSMIEEEDPRVDKTIINPVAQEEIEKIRRQKKLAEEKAKAEAEKLQAPVPVKNNEVVVGSENALVSSDETTQMFKLDRTGLLQTAEEVEETIEKEIRKVQKQREKEEGIDDEQESEEDEAGKKKKKIIIFVAVLAIFYAVMFPEDKPKQQTFKHFEPVITFPIPFDAADPNKAKAEFERGLKQLSAGTYPNLIKAGLSFKNAYENNINDITALSFMVRTYAEELEHSSEKLRDAQTIFNVIQSKRTELLQDTNGVIGLNLFYMAINKKDAANDVIAKYLKLKPKELIPDLFAVYVLSLISNGKIDGNTIQFVKAMERIPRKNVYVYKALIEYDLFNQNTDQANDLLNEALKNHPKNIYLLLKKADMEIKNGNFKGAVPFLKKAEALNLDYNNSNRAKFLELKGMIYAANKKPKEATAYFTKSLKLVDSDDLRIKLANLESTDGAMVETDKLINESTAVKHLIQARKFFDERNYNLALSAAAKATDAYPGHIPSEIFLSKVQLRLGLAREALKTLEDLVAKYPDDKNVNIALAKAYVETYKFNDVRTRIQIMSGTDIKESWEFASIKAQLFLKMKDPMQAMMWLRTSINLNPLNDEDIFALSNILHRMGKFDNVKVLLNKCMELDPVNPDYRIAYARLVYETQDDQAAIGYLLSLQNEFGENPKVLGEIAIFYYRAGKVKDFQDYKEKLEKLHSSDKALYEFLVKAALLDERYTEVPLLVEKLLAVEPGELEYMMTAGKVLFDSKKFVDAAKWFKRVQDKLPSYPKVLYYQAKIDFLSGDLDTALKKIQEDIKANGETDDDLVFMAQIYQEKEDYIQAENLYKKAQKINPRSYDAIIGLADLSTKRNNHDLALDLYKRAIKLNEEEPLVHKKIGDVYRQLGQGSLAIEAYKLYLEMDPESPHKKNLENYMELMR